MGTPMPFEAFISYARPDETAAKAACDALEAAGIGCWIAPRDVVPGLEWSASIVTAIDRCRIMVLIFSSAANASRQVLRETERAADRGIPIVPLRIENLTPAGALDYFLGSVHWLDAFPAPLEPHLELLVRAARSLLAAEPNTGPARAAAPTGPSGMARQAPPAVADNGRSRPKFRLQSLQGPPRSRWLGIAASRWSRVVPVLGGAAMTVASLLVLIYEPSVIATVLFLAFAAATLGLIYSYLSKGPLQREVTLGLEGDFNDIVEVCLAVLRKMEATIVSVDRQSGRIEASTRWSWRSAGENLMIHITESASGQYQVKVRSDNKSHSTVFDWGKNAMNLHRFVAELTE